MRNIEANDLKKLKKNRFGDSIWLIRFYMCSPLKLYATDYQFLCREYTLSLPTCKWKHPARIPEYSRKCPDLPGFVDSFWKLRGSYTRILPRFLTYNDAASCR